LPAGASFHKIGGGLISCAQWPAAQIRATKRINNMLPIRIRRWRIGELVGRTRAGNGRIRVDVQGFRALRFPARAEIRVGIVFSLNNVRRGPAGQARIRWAGLRMSRTNGAQGANVTATPSGKWDASSTLLQSAARELNRRVPKADKRVVEDLFLFPFLAPAWVFHTLFV